MRTCTSSEDKSTVGVRLKSQLKAMAPANLLAAIIPRVREVIPGLVTCSQDYCKVAHLGLPLKTVPLRAEEKGRQVKALSTGLVFRITSPYTSSHSSSPITTKNIFCQFYSSFIGYRFASGPNLRSQGPISSGSSYLEEMPTPVRIQPLS